MIIIGAGMAGLLAAAMLRNEATTVIEGQKELPNNHSAVLRFRSSVVGDVLNIPFKKVKVMKAIAIESNPIADALSYSWKTNGKLTLRSSISAKGEIEERYIAPPDLIEQMAKRVMCPLLLGTKASEEHWGGRLPVISTIPMPVLMEALGWNDELFSYRDFDYIPGFNVNFDLPECDVYATLYVPTRKLRFSRISITGSRVTIEYSFPGLHPGDMEEMMEDDERINAEIEVAGRLLGLDITPPLWEAKRQAYHKILPIDDTLRKRFILWASEAHNIYSLGRFATWRPGLLLDDLVNDVRVIQRLRTSGSYDHRK
jgi:hypothetical protein